MTAPAAPFQVSSTLKVTCVTMARPLGVAIHAARTFMTSPTKMVLALDTSDSNVGGITVVERATPAINSVQITDSGTSRRIRSLLGMRPQE